MDLFADGLSEKHTLAPYCVIPNAARNLGLHCCSQESGAFPSFGMTN
jgi:hypothetical protein